MFNQMASRTPPAQENNTDSLIANRVNSSDELAAQSPTYAAMREMHQRVQAEKDNTKSKRSIWGTIGGLAGPEAGKMIFDARYQNAHANDADMDRFLQASQIDSSNRLAERGLDQSGRKLDIEEAQGNRQLDIAEKDSARDAEFREKSLALEQVKVELERARIEGDDRRVRELAVLQMQLERDLQASAQQHEGSILSARIAADQAAQASQQGFQSTEADKDKAFRTGERVGEQDWRSLENARANRTALLGAGITDSSILNSINPDGDFESTRIEGPGSLGYGGGTAITVADAIKQGVTIPQQAYARDPDKSAIFDRANKIIEENRKLGAYGYRNEGKETSAGWGDPTRANLPPEMYYLRGE